MTKKKQAAEGEAVAVAALVGLLAADRDPRRIVKEEALIGLRRELDELPVAFVERLIVDDHDLGRLRHARQEQGAGEERGSGIGTSAPGRAGGRVRWPPPRRHRGTGRTRRCEQPRYMRARRPPGPSTSKDVQELR